LLDVLVVLSKKIGCYKVSLECRDPMVEFYQQFGFVATGGQNYMEQRWFD
jgi:glucosamine-phosphate N-acetyltransferase